MFSQYNGFMIIYLDLELLKNEKFTFMKEPIFVGERNIYLKNAAERLMAERKKLFQGEDDKDVIQSKGCWKARMESLLPSLDYLQTKNVNVYEKYKEIFDYYYIDAANTNSTSIDCKIEDYIALEKEDRELSIVQNEKLEEVLGYIHNYKFFLERRLMFDLFRHYPTTPVERIKALKIGESLENYYVLGNAQITLKYYADRMIVQPGMVRSRPTISCSFLSRNNLNTYNNMSIGFLYEMSVTNVIHMCPYDSYSLCVSDCGYIKLLKGGSLEGHDVVDYNDYESSSWTSDTYSQYSNSNYKEKIEEILRRKNTWQPVAPVLPYEVLTSNKESYNEVRIANIIPAYGIFCKEFHFEQQRFELEAASYVYDIPVFTLGTKLTRVF